SPATGCRWVCARSCPRGCCSWPWAARPRPAYGRTTSRSGRSIPYGRPLSNQSFRVVGEDGLDCPDWVPGELWIGGGSLADGY
ncbi:AMP-binding protein, partial [Adlercreutzia equolifaciens]|uniref:AMP-binding protein n=1 Tax=Adlercreutzia equolifaciens TaxID=446660 RepID=UPI003F688A90